jgi:hypothetical protein
MSGPRHAARKRRVWPAVVVIVLLAAGAGTAAGAAGARWSDARVEVLPPPVTAPTEELPVLIAVDRGAEPSRTGGRYALEPYSAETRAAVLATWGVGSTDGETRVDAAVATDGAVPHATPCTSCTGTEGIVLGGRRDPPANVVRVVVFPRPEDAVAAECGFADVGPDEIAVAVVTGNPGAVELRLGRDRYVVESDDDERDEWEAWMDGPAGDRPAGSLVVHCIALPAPDGDDPVVLSVEARDGTGHAASTVAALVPLGAGRLPIVLTPLDPTLLAVSVPLARATDLASVALGSPGEDCNAGSPAGWRPGSEQVDSAPPARGERPYLAAAPAALRRVVPVAEGEATQVCIVTDLGERRVLVTPPDARRLTLAVTDVDVTAGTAVDVQGMFPSLGWTPCRGVAERGQETVLCESGGDSGALAAAGGLLDLAVRSGSATERARIPLSAAVGGPDAQVYRLAVPGDGGTVEVTARWDDGATGATADWRFALPT